MRSEGDNWDITTSVGATALMVAASRAYISEDENPLIIDPYARLFVEAANYDKIDFFDSSSWAPEYKALFTWMKVHMAVRTKIIDDAIIIAVDRGVRQLVILASGLDTRPYRLAGLQDVTTFEVDRERVLEFKESVLNKHSAKALGEHKSIAADLRDNWIAELIGVGFNSQVPTIWVTEGLLPYLPGEAQWKLAQTIEYNSAPGSRWILDISDPEFIQKFKSMPSTGPIDINSLFYQEGIPASVDLVSSWVVQKETIGENREKYNFVSPLIPPEFLAGKSDKEKDFLLHAMYDSGFYIADK